MLSDENKRIGNIQAGFMMAIAVLADAIQALTKLLALIPFAGWLAALVVGWSVTICAIPGFWLWFRLNEIKMIDKAGGKVVRKVLVKLSGPLIETIPLINALPGWTFSVTATIIMSRIDDIKKEKEMEMKKKLHRKIRKKKSVVPQAA